MGRACDCCGDDVVCDDITPCQSCYDDSCGETDELNIDDYVSVIVMAHNIDDDEKNNCIDDDCDFVDVPFDIHIGPYFGSDIGENSKYVNKKKGELDHATKIGQTAPFVDSEACGGFDPVCKCITPYYLVYDNGTVTIDGELIPISKEYYNFGNRRNIPSLGLPDRNDDRYAGNYEGYIVYRNYAKSDCDRIGGQFVFDSDCKQKPTPSFTSAFEYAFLLWPEYLYSSFLAWNRPDTAIVMEHTLPPDDIYSFFDNPSGSYPINPTEWHENDPRFSSVILVDGRETQLRYYDASLYSFSHGYGPAEEAYTKGFYYSGALINTIEIDENTIEQYYQTILSVDIDSIAANGGEYGITIGEAAQVLPPFTATYNDGKTITSFYEDAPQIFIDGSPVGAHDVYFEATQFGAVFPPTFSRAQQHPENDGRFPVIAITNNKTGEIYRPRLILVENRFENNAFTNRFTYETSDEIRSSSSGDKYTAVEEDSFFTSWRAAYKIYGRNAFGIYPHSRASALLTRLPDLSPTFDPSIQSPNVPSSSRTKISVTIAATSEAAVNKLRSSISAANPRCEGFCGYNYYDGRSSGSADYNDSNNRWKIEEEIRYALDNDQVIIYDKAELFEKHSEFCKAFPDYAASSAFYGNAGVPNYYYQPVAAQSYNDMAIYLNSETPFNGGVEIYNFSIRGDVLSGPTTARHDIDRDRNISSKLDTAKLRLNDNNNKISPLVFYDVDDPAELEDAEKEYLREFYAFKMFDVCPIDYCCTLKEELENYSLEIDLGQNDYGGKEPAFYEYYYHFAPTEEITYTMTASNGHTCEFTSTQLDRGELPECLFQRDYRTGYSTSLPIYYKVDYGKNGGRFHTSIDQFNSVGFMSNDDYLIDDERLMPDCKYDLKIVHSPRADENPYGCDNRAGYSRFSAGTTYIKPWEGEESAINTTIIQGTQYGAVETDSYPFEPYIFSDGSNPSRCKWRVGYDPNLWEAEEGDIRCGNIHTIKYCGFLNTGIGSMQIPIVQSINDPASTCRTKVTASRIATYTGYYAVGEAAPEDGYCDERGPRDSAYYPGCKEGNVLKKATTTEWLEKSMGKGCSGMITYERIYGSDAREIESERKIVQYTVFPDPRERHNRDIEVLRIKNSEYKGGKFTLNFKDAEEHTDELGSFFIIRGPDLAQLFDTGKIDLSFIDGPSLDDHLAETFNTSHYGKTRPYSLYIENQPNLIGVETVPLSSGMEFRYRIIGGNVAYSLTYPISLSAHNVTQLGKSIDVFGRMRCVDDCCTEFEHDPPIVSRGACTLAGEGVGRSIQNSEGLNSGWEFHRRTALFQKVADNIPDSYNVRNFDLGVYSRTTSCDSFISSLNTLFIETTSSYLSWFDRIGTGGNAWSIYIPRRLEGESSINPNWSQYRSAGDFSIVAQPAYFYYDYTVNLYARACGDVEIVNVGNEICNAAGGDRYDELSYYDYRFWQPPQSPEISLIVIKQE
jgi:hypothetical protein